jgi:hypothetical protein
MPLTVEEMKRHLHILHEDDDLQLADLIAWSAAEIVRFADEDNDAAASGLNLAQIILIRWRYYPDEEVELDDIYNMPRAFVALMAGSYRTPTLA